MLNLIKKHNIKYQQFIIQYTLYHSEKNNFESPYGHDDYADTTKTYKNKSRNYLKSLGY